MNFQNESLSQDAPYIRELTVDYHHVHFRLRCCPCPIWWGKKCQRQLVTSSITDSVFKAAIWNCNLHQISYVCCYRGLWACSGSPKLCSFIGHPAQFIWLNHKNYGTQSPKNALDRHLQHLTFNKLICNDLHYKNSGSPKLNSNFWQYLCSEISLYSRTAPLPSHSHVFQLRIGLCLRIFRLTLVHCRPSSAAHQPPLSQQARRITIAGVLHKPCH